jgi:5-methylcytosine-specific restriction enzyme A
MGILKNVMDVAKGKKPSGAMRSPKWEGVRKKFLAKNPVCAACGETKSLEVHHIKPFHLHPEFELDETNLITLCEVASNGVVCHMNVGHNGDYKSWNVDVVVDAKRMLYRVQNRPYEK